MRTRPCVLKVAVVVAALVGALASGEPLGWAALVAAINQLLPR